MIQKQKFFRVPPMLSRHIFTYGTIGCQPAESKVLMADGTWKNIEDVKIGDRILSPQKDGFSTFEKVESTCYWPSHKNYEVRKLSGKGSKLYECSFNHIIPVNHFKSIRKTIDKKRVYKGHSYSIEEYSAEHLANLSPQNRVSNNIGISCPLINKFKGRIDCLIDPYTLGVFLGDGSFTKDHQPSITSPDTEIIKCIPYNITRIVQGRGCKSYYFSMKGELGIFLKKLGLYGKKSGDKFIPLDAKLSSADYRKKLLAGLLDTDGYYKNGGYSITFKSYQLISDLRDVVYSLGGKCGDVRKVKKGIKSTGFVGEYYTMSIYLGGLDLPLQTLRRKRNIDLGYNSANRISLNLVPSKPSQVYGFSITGDSKWYITDNWMLTHNSGKTCKNLAIAQQYYELNYKVWDVYGGKRNEGPFWCLPNDDKKLWDIAERETHEFKVKGPKNYRVNLLYPCFLSTMPKKLPQSPEGDGRVKSRIFTIPIKDLNMEDIRHAIGEITSNNTIYYWETIFENLDNKSTSQDINYIVDYLMTKPSKKEKNEDSGVKMSPLYRIFLKSLLNEGLLTTSSFDYNLDVITEADDKKVITILCLDYVPERFKIFVMQYFLRKIVDNLREDKIHRKHIGLFREASDFMKMENTTEDRNSPIPIFRNTINKIARYGRDGFHMIMDTQSPKEVKGMIEGAEDLLIINEMPSPSDRENLLDPIRKDNRMTSAQFHYIATMKIHEMCIIEKGQRARILRRVFPPRSRYWKEGKGNFYTIWGNEVGHWRSTALDIEKIEEMLNESRKRVALKIATLKAKSNQYTDEPEEDEGEVTPTVIVDSEPVIKVPTNEMLLNEQYEASLEKKKQNDEIRRKNKELAQSQGL